MPVLCIGANTDLRALEHSESKVWCTKECCLQSSNASVAECVPDASCTFPCLPILQLILPQDQYGAVLRQLKRDLDLLQRLHVIDYSLLLGVHFARCELWG